MSRAFAGGKEKHRVCGPEMTVLKSTTFKCEWPLQTSKLTDDITRFRYKHWVRERHQQRALRTGTVTYVDRYKGRNTDACRWDLVWQAETSQQVRGQNRCSGTGLGSQPSQPQSVLSARRGWWQHHRSRLRACSGASGRPTGTEAGSRRWRAAGTSRKWPGLWWSHWHLSPSEFKRLYHSAYTVKNIHPTVVLSYSSCS